MVEREVLLIAFRRDARPLGKHPLEVHRREADGVRNLVKFRLLAHSAVDVVNSAGDYGVVVGIMCHRGSVAGRGRMRHPILAGRGVGGL